MPEKSEGFLPPQEQKDEITKELLDQCGGSREKAQKVLAARNKYDMKWWESDDPVEVALGQLNEPVLLVDPEKLHDALEKALGREVDSSEFGINADGLRQELATKRKPQK